MPFLKRQQTKAAHYIQMLDEARCSGDWNAVPELVRKIRKHAPERTCRCHPTGNIYFASHMLLNL